MDLFDGELLLDLAFGVEEFEDRVGPTQVLEVSSMIRGR
jgi:hypothetical protein